MRDRIQRFFTVTARWRLSHDERRVLLGMTESEYRTLVTQADAVVSATALERVEAVLALEDVVERHAHQWAHVDRWLRAPRGQPPFRGAAPLQVLLQNPDGPRMLYSALVDEAERD